MNYTYFMLRRNYGTHYGYEISAYGPLYRGPVKVVRDVSPDAQLVRRMVTTFNREQLPPDRLADAIQNFLSLK